MYQTWAYNAKCDSKFKTEIIKLSEKVLTIVKACQLITELKLHEILLSER